MFDSMMKEILDQVGGLSSQNTELCSLLRNILQVLCISNEYRTSVCFIFAENHSSQFTSNQ